ncbi:MAG: hypothetical protein ACKO96_46530, partial [Flammeovirgaceae bacterium]
WADSSFQSLTNGYIVGGFGATYLSSIEVLSFSNDAITTSGASLTTATYGGEGLSANNWSGWVRV